MIRSLWLRWRLPLAIIAGSRLVAIGLLAWGSTRLGAATGTELPIHPPLDIWDGAWYLSIAAGGYHATPLALGPGGGFYDIAFWPAWPTLIRILSLGGLLSLPLVGVVAANVLFAAAGAAIFAWYERTWNRPVALRALTLLCFGPAAYVGSLDYSEPLFLLLVAGWFIARGHRYRRAILAMAAGFTRVTGLAIGAASAVRLVLARGRDGEAATSAAGSAVAFAAWWVAVGVILGDPVGWLRGSPAWFAAGGVSGGPGSLAILVGENLDWWILAAGIGLWVAVAAAGALLLVRERRLEAAAYAGAILAAAAFGAWSSWPRLILVAFPIWGALAAHLDGRRWRLLMGAAFALELVLAPLAGAGMLVP